MEDFRRNTRFVAGGHTSYTRHAMAYANVVSRESVRISLTLAALNDVWTVLLIPQVRPARKYSIPPWEMIHLLREIAQ
jgi:hypothetical protein